MSTTTTVVAELTALAAELEAVDTDRVRLLARRAVLARQARAEGVPWAVVNEAMGVSREMGRRIAGRE